MTRPLEQPSPFHAGYAGTSTRADAVRITRDAREHVAEQLAEETPVTLVYNGVPHAVMMATPDDLEDFATGFTLTEGIARRAGEISRVEVVRYSRGIELQVEVPAELAVAANPRSRRLSGRTGCGICGTEDVDRVLRTLPPVRSSARFDSASISAAMRSLELRQPLNALTGAVHAAAWAMPDGTIELVREDVGRHNALDKLAGALIRAGLPAHEGFVVMSSRGSFELVQKAVMLGVPLLATVSAPSALAVRVAQSAMLTLAGFVRGDRVTAYSCDERIS